MPVYVRTPVLWTNQNLLLYHGTLRTHAVTIVQTGVNVTLGRTHTDFGRGFYTTTVEQQARSWAWQLAQRIRGASPAVVRFDVSRDALAALDSLWFVRGSFDGEDFWSLVFYCRTGGAAHGRTVNQDWYDVVVGPIAASWRTRLAIYDADQISFHTSRGANLLNNSNPVVLP